MFAMIAVALTPSRAQGATFAARDFSTANKVTFLSEGEKIVAFLFTPPGFDPTSKEKLPAVGFIGPMSGLKDQVTGVYARKLAALGYATISFDPRYQGESDGKPRDLESPSRKVEDLRSAIGYLRSLPYVDVSRISVIGICGGGGVAARPTLQFTGLSVSRPTTMTHGKNER